MTWRWPSSWWCGTGAMSAGRSSGRRTESLEVFISEVDQAWLEQHLGMLAVLVSETELDAGGVRLRVDV